MTEEEIIEGNKLISKFMGQSGHSCKNSYNENWNALMPVIEKISLYSIKEDEVIKNGSESYFDSCYPRTFGMVNAETKEFMFRINGFALHQSEQLITAAWYSVVQFIKWHNSNSPT